MTVLVTGATGLVGSRLLPRLVAAGLECRAIVRGGKASIPGVTVVDADLLQPDTLVQAVTGASAIVHLAAVFRTPDPDLIWRANVDGTRNLIETASRYAPTLRFIMASTSNVYGMDGAHPGREDDAVDPMHPYPASKLAAESLLRASGLTWSILRFGFVYGDGDGHLESLPGHVRQGGWHPAKRMSLLHHRDIATAARLALSGATDGRIVNIADDAPTSIYELVGLVGEKMDMCAEPLSHPWHLLVDTRSARTLGFEPSVRSVHQAMHEGLM
ncbi:NAD(P)-dependent oxidoreductase [Acuticoccus sp. M5D2P5]|uniref:NAD-dependent epimerase/dehydratase family protein n=1 Tax=Acuticoccus kalidii TaxID=2910977 RepID=UPI001F40F6B2|nr:NAD(P)-dependent oxidoreductase [Acuticoccus kalidii]